MRIALGWFYWVLYQCASLALFVIGLPLVAVLSLLHFWKCEEQPRVEWGREHGWHWRSKLFWLWDNDEDGITPYYLPDFKSVWRWAAWRNSVNNMRFLRGAFFVVPDRVEWHSYWQGRVWIVTSGWRQCVFLFGKFRFGWGLYPGFTKGWRSWPVIERI